MRTGAFFKLVKLMMKEEYRFHSSFSSVFSFLSFPVIAFVLGGVLQLLLGRAGVARADLAIYVHFFIFGYGFAPASMGFFAKDIVDRRFGAVFFLYQLPAFLPLTFGDTFAAFYCCEVSFYFLYLVLPVTLGQLVMLPFTHVAFAGIAAFALSATVCFAVGLSLAFLIGALFQRSSAAFFATVAVIGSGLLAGMILGYRNMDALKDMLFGTSRWTVFLLLAASGLSVSILLTRIAAAVVPNTPRTQTSVYENSFSGLGRRTSFMGPAAGSLVAKELLDMKRSRTLSKLTFSFLLPLLILASLIWLVERSLGIILPINTMFYGGMIGFFGVMVYSWLNNMDGPECYQYVPVSVPDVVAARLAIYLLVNTPLGLLVVVFMALVRGETGQLLLAIPMFIMISIYMSTATAFLAGIRPNTLLFKAGPGFKFNMLAMGPLVMLGVITIAMGRSDSAAAISTALSCIVLAVASVVLFRGVRGRWQTALFMA